MRAATRLLASVKPPRFLEAGTPTGLTGLFTHASPRSTLIFLYKSTLDKLKQFPESSVYRQSTEALTKHRLKIIESAKPDGYDAWEQRMRKAVEANPDVFKSGSPLVYELSDKSRFVTATIREEIDEREEEWDGEAYQAPQLEGPRTAFERKNQAAQIGADKEDAGRPDIQYELEPEPPLSTQQYVGLAKPSSCFATKALGHQDYRSANMLLPGLPKLRIKSVLDCWKRSFRLRRESSIWWVRWPTPKCKCTFYETHSCGLHAMYR